MNNEQKFHILPNIRVDNTIPRIFENVTEMCKALGFIPKKICQVGAAEADELQYIEFVNNGAKALLFEPNPEFFKLLKEKYKNNHNISLFEIGIYNRVGKFKFYERWAGTFLSEVNSPPVRSQNINLLDRPGYSNDEKDAFYCECAKFNGFDDGDIDLFLIDTEGAEWECIEQMISRPRIMCIETHYIYSKYKNPHLDKILNWMSENNYILFAQNESDSVFLKK